MMAVGTELAEVYVHPGESHMAMEPVVLRTLLGSCVGVAFLALPRGVGALCHPMMPVCPPLAAKSVDTKNARRYVDFAIRELAHRYDALGIARSSIVVKLFGGADVLHVDRPARPTVGKMNSETALRVLQEEGFEVAASSLGGTRGLHLQFNTSSGEVLVRRLS